MKNDILGKMRPTSQRPIGIFDSGLGGLTVARSVRRLLPREDVIYFGDTARVPYGNKSRSTIIRFARDIMAFMQEKKVKVVVVACNTASSLSLQVLKESYRTPVIGVISPGVREAARLTTRGRIGVIGTTSTISSRSYDRELARVSPSSRIFSSACPLFVPLVENRFTSDKITYEVAERYLKGLKAKGVDTLILGCTHYPILKNVIAKFMGKVKLVDSSSAVARETRDMLEKEGLLARGRTRRGRLTCFVSDDVEGFRRNAGIFLKEKISVRKAVP